MLAKIIWMLVYATLVSPAAYLISWAFSDDAPLYDEVWLSSALGAVIFFIFMEIVKYYDTR